jgi:hypothetical protein
MQQLELKVELSNSDMKRLGGELRCEDLASELPPGTKQRAVHFDPPEHNLRGGLSRSSDETAVMAVERRGWVIDVGWGQPATGRTRHLMEGGSLPTVARAG